MNEALIQVPGTPYVVLKDDTALGAWALKSGSIVGEGAVFALPELQALKAGDVYLDLGAFIGDTVLPLLERGVTCIAFECCPDAFEALAINTQAFPNGRNIRAILGDGRPAKANGVFGEKNGNCGTRMVTLGEGEPTFQIDSLNLERVDFVKLDTEGTEPLVLEGMRETILRCRPKMLIELYSTILAKQGFTRQDVYDFLKSVDYVWWLAIGRWEDDRCDILCAPRGTVPE